MEQAVPKRMLITGATGFIGKHLAAAASSAGYEVWVAVRPSTRREALADLPVRFFPVDFRSAEAITEAANALCEQYHAPAWHYVVHAAGITKGRTKADFIYANATQTAVLLEGLKGTQYPPERFLLVSSLASYGEEKRQPLSLDTPQRPRSWYGQSKLLAEQYTAQSGLPYTIINLTGVYGPGDEDYLQIARGIARGWYVMAGWRTQQLSSVYVSDVVQAILLLLSDGRARGGRFLLSDGSACSDREFGRLMQRTMGKRRVRYIRVPMPLVWLVCQIAHGMSSLTHKPLSVVNRDKYYIFSRRDWRCDIDPLLALGFHPEIDLEEGLRRTITAARRQGLL